MTSKLRNTLIAIAMVAAILIGLVVSPVCYFFVTTVKNKLGYDDSLDVFGIHAVGGIVGAIGTGVVADPALGGQGWIDYTAPVAAAGEFDMVGQVITQCWAVGTTIVQPVPCRLCAELRYLKGRHQTRIRIQPTNAATHSQQQ